MGSCNEVRGVEEVGRDYWIKVNVVLEEIFIGLLMIGCYAIGFVFGCGGRIYVWNK